MPALPPRNNRVLQAVGALKEEILTGHYAGTLPGEPELAQRLRTSRSSTALLGLVGLALILHRRK